MNIIAPERVWTRLRIHFGSSIIVAITLSVSFDVVEGELSSPLRQLKTMRMAISDTKNCCGNTHWDLAVPPNVVIKRTNLNRERVHFNFRPRMSETSTIMQLTTVQYNAIQCNAIQFTTI